MKTLSPAVRLQICIASPAAVFSRIFDAISVSPRLGWGVTLDRPKWSKPR